MKLMKENLNLKEDSLRLQTLLSQSGLCSRRGAVEILSSGRVSVNGIVASEPGLRILSTDKVQIDGKDIQRDNEKKYIVLHKPSGVLSSRFDPEGRPLVMDYIPDAGKWGLYPVGRLDYYSEGLIFLTNDGYWAQTFIRPRNKVEKEYEVTTTRVVDRSQWELYEKGITVEGVRYKAVKVSMIHPIKVRILLHEGKNREIRRVVEVLGAKVRHLVRIRIGTLTIEGLKKGEWRYLTEQEIISFGRKLDTHH